MAVGDAYMFPGFITPVLTQLFFPKPQVTFLTCFCRGERRKYAGMKSRLSWGSNSRPPGHESDTLTTEPPGRGIFYGTLKVDVPFGSELLITYIFLTFQPMFWAAAVGSVSLYQNWFSPCDLESKH